MNNRWVFLGILPLVGLMLSAGVSVGGCGYEHDYGTGNFHGYGQYNYSHGYAYRDHYRGNQDDRNRDSGHGSNYWG